MRRRTFILGALAGATPARAAAQASASRIPRVGVLSMRTAESPTLALLEGLREHGYVPGRTIELVQPNARGREELLPALADELVKSGVDLILVIGPAPLAPALRATTTIPIVMVASSADPVAEGIATTLARPGGNVTGLTYAEPDRFKKQLEILKTAAPATVRVGILWDFDPEIFRRQWATPLNEAGRRLGMTILEPALVRTESELPAAFGTLRLQRADAILVAAGGILFPARATVAELAAKDRLPGIAAFREFPRAGLLLSYGPDILDINRRAGGYVERILKGARPGDLPIEMPARHDLVVNLGTARRLGLDVPQSLLLRADEIVR